MHTFDRKSRNKQKYFQINVKRMNEREQKKHHKRNSKQEYEREREGEREGARKKCNGKQCVQKGKKARTFIIILVMKKLVW